MMIVCVYKCFNINKIKVGLMIYPFSEMLKSAFKFLSVYRIAILRQN